MSCFLPACVRRNIYYRPRSRGDNTFGSVVCVCPFDCGRSLNCDLDFWHVGRPLPWLAYPFSPTDFRKIGSNRILVTVMSCYYFVLLLSSFNLLSCLCSKCSFFLIFHVAIYLVKHSLQPQDGSRSVQRCLYNLMLQFSVFFFQYH